MTGDQYDTRSAQNLMSVILQLPNFIAVEAPAQPDGSGSKRGRRARRARKRRARMSGTSDEELTLPAIEAMIRHASDQLRQLQTCDQELLNAAWLEACREVSAILIQLCEMRDNIRDAAEHPVIPAATHPTSVSNPLADLPKNNLRQSVVDVEGDLTFVTQTIDDDDEDDDDDTALEVRTPICVGAVTASQTATTKHSVARTWWADIGSDDGDDMLPTSCVDPHPDAFHLAEDA